MMWYGDINNVPSGYGVCDGRVINGISKVALYYIKNNKAQTI